MFKFYTFQTSFIMEAGDPVDPRGKVVTVKAKSEARARRTLPDIGIGRRWILVNTSDTRPAEGERGSMLSKQHR